MLGVTLFLTLAPACGYIAEEIKQENRMSDDLMLLDHGCSNTTSLGGVRGL